MNNFKFEYSVYSFYPYFLLCTRSTADSTSLLLMIINNKDYCGKDYYSMMYPTITSTSKQTDYKCKSHTIRTIKPYKLL